MIVKTLPAPPKEMEVPWKKVLKGHNSCRLSEHTFSDVCLLFQLPTKARDIALAYLHYSERSLSYMGCALGHPLKARLVDGWSVEECTELAIRTLLGRKITDLLTVAAERKEMAKKRASALTAGFWYPTDYFLELQKRKLHAHIKPLRESGAFYHGRAPKGFALIARSESPAGYRCCCFQMTENIPPTVALANLRESLCFIDCLTFLQVAAYETLSEIFGETKFNNFFRFGGNYSLSFDSKFLKTPLRYFFNQDIIGRGEVGKRPVEVGDIVYFANHTLYSKKHPLGAMRGHHFFCTATSPVQKFTGFEQPIDGIDENGIAKLFCDAYNSKPLTTVELVTERVAPNVVDKGVMIDPETGQTVSWEAFSSAAHEVTLTSAFYFDITKNSKRMGFIPLVRRPTLQSFHNVLLS